MPPPLPPWSRPAGIDTVIKRWLCDDSTRPCLTADRSLPAEAGQSSALPALHPSLTRALRASGIDSLYLHQLAAVQAARDGRHVVVATPTASGKSLCFHLPVLDAIANDDSATALYLYPTKALSRDQEASLRAFAASAELDIGATVYDGDTPGDARRSARQAAQIIMTNPDMLHAGILPQHAQWARVMQNLRYVVLDELHTYRGVFGSHVAHVLGRLRRIAQFHGANPTFVCATATIGNPIEHAAKIVGVASDDIELIDQSSAPRGPRRVLLYNPPVVNAELGIRASYIKSAVRLAADLVEARVRTLIFGQSRNTVETMLKYLRDRFSDNSKIQDAIFAYRGGYLPATRRRVEQQLRDGDILCVVATSALELGIDVGQLDAVVCAGYPGSIAETWQRFGRAGRRGDTSLAVLVSNSRPLDQFLSHNPAYLLDGSIEHARIDPNNTEILIQHLKCAAFELPFHRHEAFGTMAVDDTEDALGYLEQHGVVHASRGRFHWSSDAFPANHVSLRRVGWDNFVIINEETGLALAELDWHSTPSMLHEQAIYQHDGEQYQVEFLDYDNHKAFVRKVEPDYFTTALRNRKVSVLDESATGQVALASAGWGEVSVVEKVVGYKKIKFHTHENAGYGDVRLPDIHMHTTSFWLTLPPAICDELGHGRAIDGLRGLSHALELVATLVLMCDPRDIGQAMGDTAPGDVSASEQRFAATAYLFDNVPCGVGLAERIYERSADLLERAACLIDQCGCSRGCPCCVGATANSSEPEASSAGDRKRTAAMLVRRLGLARSSPQPARAARSRASNVIALR